MSEPRTPRRRYRLDVEAVVDVEDAQRLVRTAHEAIGETVFGVPDGWTLDEIRADEIDSVGDDPAHALSWLADVGALTHHIGGADVVESTHGVVEVDENGLEVGADPEFGRLFTSCGCGRDDCHDCGLRFTPRTACVLWKTSQTVADEAYEDILEHGDDPVSADEFWRVFGDFPRVTWTQDAIWRRRASRSADDLTSDLAQGQVPWPRCAAEEMMLHIVLDRTDIWPELPEEEWPSTLRRLPPDSADFDWEWLREVLFQDGDIQLLFDPKYDGFEDPEAVENQLLGVGDYRPPAWFDWFGGSSPRDPRRPFRR